MISIWVESAVRLPVWFVEFNDFPILIAMCGLFAWPNNGPRLGPVRGNLRSIERSLGNTTAPNGWPPT